MSWGWSFLINMEQIDPSPRHFSAGLMVEREVEGKACAMKEYVKMVPGDIKQIWL